MSICVKMGHFDDFSPNCLTKYLQPNFSGHLIKTVFIFQFNNFPIFAEKICILDSREYSRPMYVLNLPDMQAENNFVFSIETMLRITCAHGYKLIGASQITCHRHTLNGVWSEKPPVCKLGMLLSRVLHINKINVTV